MALGLLLQLPGKRCSVSARFAKLVEVSLGLPVHIFATTWERLPENKADIEEAERGCLGG